MRELPRILRSAERRATADVWIGHRLLLTSAPHTHSAGVFLDRNSVVVHSAQGHGRYSPLSPVEGVENATDPQYLLDHRRRPDPKAKVVSPGATLAVGVDQVVEEGSVDELDLADVDDDELVLGD